MEYKELEVETKSGNKIKFKAAYVAFYIAFLLFLDLVRRDFGVLAKPNFSNLCNEMKTSARRIM